MAMAEVVAPPQPKLLTYADYRALPDGGKVFGLKEGKFQLLGRYDEDLLVRSEVLAGLEFPAKTIFEA
jgi:hypothetical protein